MNLYLALTVLFCILFFVVFFYFLFNEKNKLIKFIVIKDPIEDESNLYNTMNKYKTTKCENLCSPELCNDYLIQKIKYDLCKECKKEGKCYNQYKGICESCKNYNTCEELFGCYVQPPINPLNNFCTRCWIK